MGFEWLVTGVEAASVGDQVEKEFGFGRAERGPLAQRGAGALRQASSGAVEIGAGLRSGSVSLLADAIDFLGDAANYGVSLWVLGMSLRHRAGAALLKGFSMGLFGLVVLGRALWSFSQGTVPEATTMGAVGALALLANVAVAALLYAWREGDANMRSVWLCSRPRRLKGWNSWACWAGLMPRPVSDTATRSVA